jgi:hypothetical protein
MADELHVAIEAARLSARGTDPPLDRAGALLEFEDHP